MNAIALLFAAGINGDVIEAVMVIAFLIISGLAKLASGMKSQQKPGRPTPKIQPSPMPQKKSNAPAGNDAIANEVDEFLRRAAQRNKGKGVRPVRPAKPVQRPVVAEAIGSKPVGGQITAHVKKYLDEQQFENRAEQLGVEVAHVDSEIEQHLHKTFDHAMGTLRTLPGGSLDTDVAIESADDEVFIPETSEIHKLLTDPQSIRQAIVLNEILHRPEERWA
jgi:hypothetical protein